jgi:polyvinyl alcohol dehydrogenase (cytochrome)
VLYIGSLDGTIYAVNTKDGFVRWHTQIDTPGAKIWSSPAIANGLLVIGAASTLSENPKRAGQVLAFDTTTGKMRWRAYIEQNGKAGGGVWSSPAIDAASKTVYVGTGDPDDGVEALNLQTGRVLWHWRSVVQDIGDTDIGAGPLLYSDNRKQLHIVVGGKNGNVYNLDGKTGKLLWHMRVGQHVFSSPSYANGVLYTIGLTGHSATVWALDARTGKAHWHFDIPTIIYASPAVSGQALYVATGDAFVTGDGGMTVLNTANGQQIQSINVHSAITSSPAVLSKWVLVGVRDGNLYAYVR